MENSVAVVITIIAITIAVSMFLGGYSLKEEVIEEYCAEIGKFKANDSWYLCEKVTDQQ